jgi:hypothetical protein
VGSGCGSVVGKVGCSGVCGSSSRILVNFILVFIRILPEIDDNGILLKFFKDFY